MQKTLATKLDLLARDPRADVFILADAKDADMAFGIRSPGDKICSVTGKPRLRSLAEYRDLVREITRQQLIDIMLMSSSTADALAHGERIFDDSPVTPAVRANDTTDIFAPRGGRYREIPSRPFMSGCLDHLQCGKLHPSDEERRRGVNLGLYSVTFNNRLEDDLRTLEAYRDFRFAAEEVGFQHFLEVFPPNMADAAPPEEVGHFLNDMVVRGLAGVPRASRPVFLKIIYRGPKALEELVDYDPSLIVGVMGGSAGTTYDAFKLVAEARKYGAKAALYGRKINQAENQFAFIRILRLVADGLVKPEEAVRAYHGVLQQLGIKPFRTLADDLKLETDVMDYSPEKSVARSIPGLTPSGKTIQPAAKPAVPAATTTAGATGGPNFAKMTSEERLAYHRERISKTMGESSRVTYGSAAYPTVSHKK